MEIVLLVGRAIFGLYWVSAAIQNLLGLEKGAANAGSHGVPFPRLSIIATAPILIAGGLSIAFGFYSEAGAILLIAFLIPASVLRHHFWDVADPQEAKVERRDFEKNMALIGACLLIAYFGPGPYSLH
ncbi:MAG: DoxX family protein [Chloroflexi bacterium]|nr:DoxX family protein [Chloroflexota bacterium]MCI0796390.1 DoxX family protein [Chloroflexota bacterium]MCI0887418.1 DoxX family protein [Chloroflexota bacterium]